MAVRSIKRSLYSSNPQKYQSFLAGNDAYSPFAFESIATATGTGSSGTITFSSIPSTFKHLQLRIMCNDTNNGNYLQITANNDTSASNYVRHFLKGNGTAASAGGTASGTYASWLDSSYAGYSTNTMAVKIVDILDYGSTTKNKTFRGFFGYDQNGAGDVIISSGLWLSTTAIDRLDVFVSGSNFTTASTFALYGIKEA